MKTILKNFFENFFENIWVEMFYAISVISIGTLLVFFFIAIFSTKEIKGYYLSDFEGGLQIMCDIEWIPDNSIRIDRSITYDEAINMVEKLNNTLK